MSLINHTFFALVSYSYRWALGERAHRLTQILGAYFPNAKAEATRQIARWLYPLNGTPVDALPHQLRLYGLPTYAEESYFRTLNRLRSAVLTHYASGSVDQLIAEAKAATASSGFAIDADSATNSFAITHAAVTAKRKYGDGPAYGRGAPWGHQVPAINWTRNIARTMTYFKPARERFRGFEPA